MQTKLAFLAGVMCIAACGKKDGPTQNETPVLTTITVSLTTATIRGGETAVATATGADQKGAPIETGTITWSTASSAVASVTFSGLVTGVGQGQTQVIAAVGGKQGQAQITVEVPVAAVVVTPATSSISAGGAGQLAATLRDAASNVLTGRTVTWSSSNVAVATVSPSGLVTGVSAGGPITITATSEGKSAVAQVTVTPPPVATVTVTPSPATVAAGEATQLAATLRDASNTVLTARTVTWSTSNAAIATVSSSGLVTGIAALGPVSITASSEGKSGSAAVTVLPPPVRSVSVALSNPILTVGQSSQATATLRDINGNELVGRAVTWSSANPAVASVTQTGLVTGVAAGGPVSISASSEGSAGSASVTVLPFNGVTSVTVTPTSETLRGSTPGFGWTRQLQWIVNGSSGIGQAVTFLSLNTFVAKVSAAGVVTAGAEGVTQIQVTSVADPSKFGTFDVTVVDGCTQKMPVALGYTMTFTLMCSSGADRYSYTAPTSTWVQLVANVSAFPSGSCSTFLIPFEYVVGNTSTARGYSRICSVLAGTWAYVRAGPNRFHIQKGNIFATSYSYTGASISMVPALPQCTAFSTDYGVTFSVDLTVTCTSHRALLATRNGSVGITSSSAVMAITIELVNGSNNTVVATATSSGPGASASVSLASVTTSDVLDIRIKPAVAGGSGAVSVTVNP